MAIMENNTKTLSYDEFMGELLQDPKFVEEYLNEKLASGDLEQFLLALSNLMKARGGATEMAKKTGLGRQTIYKSFSGKGNPTLNSLQTFLTEVGLRLSVESAKKPPGKKKPARRKTVTA